MGGALLEIWLKSMPNLLGYALCLWGMFTLTITFVRGGGSPWARSRENRLDASSQTPQL